MLGSIQKYRPTRRPQPYNAGTQRQLQGITSPQKQPSGPVKGKHLVTQDSLYMESSTYSTHMPAIKSVTVTKEGEIDSPRMLQTVRTRNSNRQDFQTMDISHSNRQKRVGQGLGFATDTIDQQSEAHQISQFGGSQSNRPKRNVPWRQSAADQSVADISESLYPRDLNAQMGQLGRVINSTLRSNEPLLVAVSGLKTRMQFGSPGKYSGFQEKHWESTIDVCDNKEAGARANSLYNSVSVVKNGRFDLQSGSLDVQSAVKYRKQQRSELPPAVHNILQKQQMTVGKNKMDKLNPLEDGDRKDESLLSDSYLPALRSFSTTQRAKIPASAEVVSNFKKTQAAEKLTGHVPKVVQVETINRSIKSSLFDRQRDILMHAQMHNPANKARVKGMKETKFKHWVVNPDIIDRKVDLPKQDANAKKVKDQQQEIKVNDNKSSSQSSTDRYDPLADSDCSSANSDTPNLLSKAEMEDVIRHQMRDRVNINHIQKGFWKGLVSMDDPNLPVDEEGNVIEQQKPEMSQFQMIKKMMRLKAKQQAVPESERVKNFIPQNKPEFTNNGKDKYYFDLKNNKEHYNMMTNDMTEDQYEVFEQREQNRIDDLDHQRKLMETLVERKLEQYRKAKAAREALKNKKIDISTLGEYRSKKFTVDEMKDDFQDDDELLLMQVLMDTSDRKETADAIKNHVSKQQNRKAMLCPQRVLRLSDFARDVIDGIIWQDIKERKVHPRVLYKMSTQESMGIMVNKQLARSRELEKLDKFLNKPIVRGSGLSTHDRDNEDKQQEMSDEEKDEAHLYKDLFTVSYKKNQFFEAAKQMMNSNSLNASDAATQSHMLSFKRFIERCQKSGTLAMPIFSNSHKQVLSIVGQYISDGMAQAMSEVFMRNQNGPITLIQKTDKVQPDVQQEKQEEISYIPVKEINLDDNGLKDGSFASILAALATQPSLKRLTYVNNEIGGKSIEELAKILSNENEGGLSDIRITRVKATKHDLNLLLQALSQCTNRLVRLRLSHLALDEFVLMQSLKNMIHALPHIQELNLSNINIHGRQLSDIMEVISENCQQIQYLNLSENSLPQHEDWRQQFLQHLVNMITNSAKLIDINLSGMNLRSNIQAIQWPLAKSKTLQAIHLSDNNIPKAIEINMLMVFGVKSTDDASDGFSITGKLDPRQLKRNAMSQFQVKMQQKLEGLDTAKAKKKDQEEQIFGATGGESEMVQTYEDATARIANAVEIRDLKHDKQYIQSSMKGGLGRYASSTQPLVITRKLGRPELIFNNADSKNTHFKINAQAKWVRAQGNECWVCDSWKYTVIFFSRTCWNQHYQEIEDQEKIRQLQEMYDLEQEDLLMSENKDFPLILGGVTKNTAVSMVDVCMFNLFLDEQKIKKELGGQGERALRAMLTVSQGMKNSYDSQLSGLSTDDWLNRFRENVPFNDKEMLTVNLPQTRLSAKLARGDKLTKTEKEDRKNEGHKDIYVFAGFVEPGKHQIVIKDQMTNKWFSREIVVEARRAEIVSCHHVEPEKNQESIKRFQKIDEITGKARTMIDLDSSVFMNFKRYTKQDVINCFKADMRQSSFENIVQNEEDLQDCTVIFQKNYAAYCQFFHEMAAQFDNFPLIDLTDLPKVLQSISMMEMAKAERVGEAVIARYKSIEANQPCQDQVLLNRVKFAEVLLAVLQADKVDPGSQKSHDSISEEPKKVQEKPTILAGAPVEANMGAILEEEEEKVNEFKHSQHLQTLFSAFIVPSLENKNEESMPISLNAFRDRFCWVEKVNAILELNLEGIMELFTQYQDEEGFIYDSAKDVLKGMGSLLPTRVTKMLFDLSQMTVIDESVNADEYDDMELVEFLEFLVRLAYHQYLGEDRSITLKLSDLLRDMLPLANVQFIEGPKREFETQASDEDIQAFQRYMKKNHQGLY